MEALFAQISCIRHGIPLWVVTYPHRDDDNVLISGFLSAIETFFSKTTIKSGLTNIYTIDKNWSFTKIHDQENFFLAFQYPSHNKKELRKESEILAQNLVSIVKKEFEAAFSLEDFRKFDDNLELFDAFKAKVEVLIVQYYDTVSRFKLRDNIWLAKFSGAEKLFTTILLNYPVYVVLDTREPLEKVLKKSNIKKLIATLEGLYYSSLLEYKMFTIEDRIKTVFPFTNSVYFLTDDVLSKIPQSNLPHETAIIKISQERVIAGPPPIPLAEKIVSDLRSMSHEYVETVLNPFYTCKDSTNQAIYFYQTGSLMQNGELKRILIPLDGAVRDSVIISLENQIPSLKQSLTDLCNKEHWDFSSFLRPTANGKSSIVEVICPRCTKKMYIVFEPFDEQKANITEVLINKKIPNHCGHEFVVYLDKNKKIQGYGNIKNLDENKDLKEIFSKL